MADKVITGDELKKMLVGKTITDVEVDGEGSFYDGAVHFSIGDYDQPSGLVVVTLSDGSKIGGSASEWGQFLYWPEPQKRSKSQRIAGPQIMVR